MTRRVLAAALLAASCAVPAVAAQEKAREERPAEEACRAAAQRHRAAEENLRKAKEEGAAAKIVERRSAEAERARRDYCACLARSGGKSGEASTEQDAICGPRSTLPATSGENASALPTPTPAEAGAACADEAASYEKTWIRYSEDTKNKSLHRQLQSSKTRLCGCLTKNYGYEGVLPQPLRGFCEDRESLTPPYFPSRGEKPTTAAP